MLLRGWYKQSRLKASQALQIGSSSPAVRERKPWLLKRNATSEIAVNYPSQLLEIISECLSIKVIFPCKMLVLCLHRNMTKRKFSLYLATILDWAFETKIMRGYNYFSCNSWALTLPSVSRQKLKTYQIWSLRPIINVFNSASFILYSYLMKSQQHAVTNSNKQ